MPISAIVGFLATTFGPTLAKKIAQRLPAGKSKLDILTELLKNGESASAALKNTFGEDVINKIFSDISGNRKNNWTYEAGQQDYILIETEALDELKKINLLHDELNINLDRVTRDNDPNNDAQNYFLGLYSAWPKTPCFKKIHLLKV